MKLKICLLVAVLILGLGNAVWASDNKSIALYLSDTKVNPEVRVFEKNGVRFVNLPFLTRYMHVVAAWDADKKDIFLRFGKLSILMFEDSSNYTVNGEPRHLENAPFQRDGQLWLPVEYLIRLGLVIKKEDAQSLYLDWKANYLLGVENTVYQNRPAFLLVAGKPFQTKDFLLTQPERLVIELAGVQAHFALDSVECKSEMVKKVRFSQTDPDTLRLVFDLNRLAGYRIIPDPEHENQMLVIFNYFVEEVSFFQKDEERKVFIKSSFPAKYKMLNLNEPNRRLVIDLDGATLAGSSSPIPGDGAWIRSVRLSQFDPNTVRVVLDLLTPETCFLVRSREDPHLIEIRTIQQINKVSWSGEENGGKLTIESNADLVETIRKQKNPEQIQIDLDYARFAPKLTKPFIKSDQIKEINYIPVNPDTARVEIKLAYFMGYTVRFSPDRRQLTISFKNSPLLGKTVVLDAGHGGVDMGACGRQGTREKDVNLEVTMRLKDLLEEAGAFVVLTRVDDTFISLYERSFLANYIMADLFVSIHTNNHPNYNVQGIEVYHYSGRPQSKILAKSVLDKMTESTNLIGLGVKVNDFAVNRESQMPNILIELGYLSNYQEESTIRTTEFRENAAQGIFQGITNYYLK